MSPSSRRAAGSPLWTLVPVVALAAIVRLVAIGRDALWLDEGYSWWDARQSLAALWSVVPQCDPHPPLYFALLHGWIAIAGDGTIAMRAPSVLFGCSAVAIVYMAGRELDRWQDRDPSDPGIALLAGLFFALVPFQVHFSIEARPYALLCLAAAMVTWGALRIARTASRARSVSRSGWALLVTGSTVALWTNNTAVLLLGALAVFFIGLWIVDRDSRGAIVPVVLAGVVVALLWAPDVPVLLQQMREVSDEFWIARPSLAGLGFELHYLVGLDDFRLTWWMVLAMCAGLFLVARRISWRAGALLAALTILPVALNIAISAWMSPILIARALIGITPAFIVALAAGVMLVRTRPLRLALATVLLVVHGIAVANFLSADHVKEPWKTVVARLANVALDTRVLVVPDDLALPLGHELAQAGLPLRLRGVPADYPAIGLPMRYPSGKCAPSVVGQDLSGLAHELGSERRVVLLTRLHNTYDPDDRVAAMLREQRFTLQGEEVFQPGDLRLMRWTRSTNP